mmetsp:Transcript_23499/g.35709  ORF Transcript_23499/g.35709 Transcript_23499/m.35709 type:complete len:335 (-) Transcript_23499:27-1031(-)
MYYDLCNRLIPTITTWCFAILLIAQCPRICNARNVTCNLSRDSYVVMLDPAKNGSNFNSRASSGYAIREDELFQFNENNSSIGFEQISITAKKCECNPEEPFYFCLTDRGENFCLYSVDDPVRNAYCFRRTIADSFIHTFWAPIYYCLLIAFGSLFLTNNGKQTRNYIMAKCFPRRNIKIVNEILRREAERRRLLRAAYAARSPEARPDGMRQKLSLILKTTTFESATATYKTNENANANSNSKSEEVIKGDIEKVAGSSQSGDQNESDDAVMCSICMMDLEPGDRVGALPCKHYFHAECLKTWVVWRNTCPLCNSPDIASSRLRLVSTSEDQD